MMNIHLSDSSDHFLSEKILLSNPNRFPSLGRVQAAVGFCGAIPAAGLEWVHSAAANFPVEDLVEGL